MAFFVVLIGQRAWRPGLREGGVQGSISMKTAIFWSRGRSGLRFLFRRPSESFFILIDRP
jgi:hypothetical protein